MRFKILLLLISFSLYATSLPKEYCSLDFTRNTYILIDGNIDRNYVKKVVKKLTYTPHEKVHIYMFNGGAFEPVFDLCIPKFSSSEIQEFKKSSIWNKFLNDKIGKAQDDKQLLKVMMLKNITSSKATKSNPSSLTNALGVFSNTITNQYSRIILFTNTSLKAVKNGDFNYAYSYLFSKRLGKNSIILAKQYFNLNRGFLHKINYISRENITSYHPFKTSLNMIINGKKLKSKLSFAYDQKGKIYNGWFRVYGVLAAPVDGKVRVRGRNLLKAKLKVVDNYKCCKNLVYKGDKLDFKRGRGKYYNYSFVKPDGNYFEYRVVK